MREPWILLTVGVVALLTGCATLKQAKLLEPTWFGMERIAPRVYAARDVPEEKRQELSALYEEGKRRVAMFYGNLLTDPRILGCATQACIESFGGHGDGFATGKVRPSLLLWTKTFGAGEVAHEWAHLELFARVGPEGGRAVPMWFHEGLATVVGGIPRHSEAVYQEAVSSGYPIPPLSELRTGVQWGDAFKKYSNPKGLNVVYATAGHEVRAWLQRVGKEGLFALFERLKSGESFTLPPSMRSAREAPQRVTRWWSLMPDLIYQDVGVS
jgi:hypothetical protein